MELDCVKIVPGGNPTVLVVTPVPPEDRAQVAAWIMGAEGLGGEQVGFVDLAAGVPRLAMMGGEFCGNACRAMAVLLVERGRVRPGAIVAVAASGMEAPVAVVAHREAQHWQASVRVPGNVRAQVVAPGAWIVRLPGIVHLLLDAERFPFNARTCHEEAAVWRQRLDLESEAAVGCIWFRHEETRLGIYPLVWVRALASSILETACGSGTLALVAACPHLPWAHGVRVEQPSRQVLEVRAQEDGLWLGGPAYCSVRAIVAIP